MRPILLLLIGLATLELAAGPPQSKPSVEQLIRNLGDHRYAVREGAAKAIEALGTQALPALRKAQHDPDPQIRARIAKWIPQLEAETVVAPRLVTLHLKQRSLPEVVAAFSKQSGYKVELEDKLKQAAGRFDFDFDNVPFWNALDEICSRSGLKADAASGEGPALLLSLEKAHNPHVHRHGAFRVLVNELDYTLVRSLALTPPPVNWRRDNPDFGTRTKNDEVQIGLAVQAEPRLTILEGCPHEIECTTRC